MEKKIVKKISNPRMVRKEKNQTKRILRYEHGGDGNDNITHVGTSGNDKLVGKGGKGDDKIKQKGKDNCRKRR